MELYDCKPALPFSKLWANLPEGLSESINSEHTSETYRCLTDGTNHVWSNSVEDGTDTEFVRYMGNDPSATFDAVQQAFAVTIFSEHEDDEERARQPRPSWTEAMRRLNQIMGKRN